jgi:hypothetical protein
VRAERPVSEPGLAPAAPWRGRLTDPLVPVLLLTGAAAVAVATVPPLTWAVTGGLAGWSLSGSV